MITKYKNELNRILESKKVVFLKIFLMTIFLTGLTSTLAACTMTTLNGTANYCYMRSGQPLLLKQIGFKLSY